MIRMIYVLALLLSTVTAAMDQDRVEIQESDDSAASLVDNKASENTDTDNTEIDQNEIDDCDALIICEQIPSCSEIQGEDSTSWTSYLVSPLKATMQVGNEFVSIAVRNPKLALAMGCAYALPAVAAAFNCSCVCYVYPGSGQCFNVREVGKANGLYDCIQSCTALSSKCNPSFYSCK